MQVLNGENLDNYCSSNRDYEEKLKQLNNQKEFLSKVQLETQNAIDDLVSGKYLDSMNKNKLESLKNIKKGLALLGIGGTITALGILNFDEIERMLTTEGEYLKGLLLGVGLSFNASMAACSIPACLYELYNYGLYNERINSYQRRLK